MGESSATVRASSSGAEEFERRMRSLDHPAAQHDDPLAELARLVGQEDPFRNVTPASRSIPPAAAAYGGVDRRYSSERRDAALPLRPDDYAGEYDAGASSGAPDDPAIVHASVEPPVFAPRAETGYSPLSRRDARPVETSADAWARGMDEHAMSPVDPGALTATRDEPAREGPAASSRRTLIVLAAVVALTGGGLAASFLAKPSRAMSTAAVATATPTILAETGPSKVQPETPSTEASAPTEPSTLLDKNKSDGTATAKVVDSVEQPVDLAQAVKPAASPPSVSTPADPEPAASSSPFPEPKKVKTILVRPDGSVIAEAPASAATDAATGGIPQTANLAFDPRTSLHLSPAGQAGAGDVAGAPAAAAPDQAPPAVAEPAVAAALPKPAKTLTRVATTPKQAAGTPSTPKVKPPVAAKPKPVAEADATPTADTAATAPTSTGAFAVQLGAPPTEAEATAVSNRLVKKFTEQLGGNRPAIHKADAGGKTVYRIRVGNLSQDDAKALCSKLQAAGGGCFVARN